MPVSIFSGFWRRVVVGLIVAAWSLGGAAEASAEGWRPRHPGGGGFRHRFAPPPRPAFGFNGPRGQRRPHGPPPQFGDAYVPAYRQQPPQATYVPPPPPQVIIFRQPPLSVSATPAPSAPPTIIFRSSMPPDQTADASTQTNPPPQSSLSPQPTWSPQPTVTPQVTWSQPAYSPTSPSTPAVGQVPGVIVSVHPPTSSTSTTPESTTYEVSGLPADFSAAALP